MELYLNYNISFLNDNNKAGFKTVLKICYYVLKHLK